VQRNVRCNYGRANYPTDWRRVTGHEIILQNATGSGCRLLPQGKPLVMIKSSVF